MKYTADIHCQLTGKKLTTVEFDTEYAPGQELPYDKEWLAKTAAARKGVRNTQWVNVRNIKPKE